MAFLDWLKNLFGSKPADTAAPDSGTPNTPPAGTAENDQNKTQGGM